MLHHAHKLAAMFVYIRSHARPTVLSFLDEEIASLNNTPELWEREKNKDQTDGMICCTLNPLGHL